MFQKARETAYLESTSLFVTLIKWRKPLIFVVLATAVSAYVFSGPYFIKPKYKSTVIFFPAATNSVSKVLLDGNTSDRQDLLAFGQEEQAEQMLQILYSDEIRNAIVEKYDLMKHYEINPQSSYPLTKLMSEYTDNISFRQTEYLSIRIDVMDTDPQMAANIANDIAALLDSLKTKIQRQRASEGLQILQVEYAEKLEAIRKMEDSLKWLRNKGIMDFSNQSIIWNEEYAHSLSAYNNEKASLEVLKRYKDDNDTSVINTRARIEGAQARIRMLQLKLDALAKYGGASVSLTEQLNLDRESLSKLKLQYDKVKVDVDQNLSHKFIINKAVAAEKKSYPLRWLIMLVSVICSFIIAMITILVIERAKEIQYN